MNVCRSKLFGILSLSIFVVCGLCHASNPNSLGEAPSELIRKLDDGRLDIHGIILDPEARTIQIPCWINMDKEVIEVLACTPFGKVHESLFVSESHPRELQLAFSLLGYRSLQLAEGEGNQTVHANALKLPKLNMAVSWIDSLGETHTVTPEHFLRQGYTNKPITGLIWGFTGCMLPDGSLPPQLDGTIVATYSDLPAVVSNLDPQAADDNSYEINEETVLPKGTNVMLLITVPRLKNTEE